MLLGRGEDFEIDNFIADLPGEVVDTIFQDDEFLRRTLSSGRTVLTVPVVGDEGSAGGLLVALFSKNDGKSSSFNPSLLKNILDPAVEMIGENLRTAREARDLARHVSERVQQPSSLLDISFGDSY